MFLPLNNEKGQSEQGAWHSPSPSAGPSHLLSGEEAMPCFLPTFLITTVMKVSDINFSSILVNYWICYHNNPDNCTTDLCLLLYRCLEIKCLSLKLVWFLYPKLLKTWQGHLKRLQYDTYSATYRL